MRRDRPISEEELHAYVDGVIEPERRLQIAVYLADHPLEAARTEAFRAQSDGLHALFDGVLEQPLPDGWRRLMARHATGAIWRRRCALGLVAMAVMAVLLLGSGTLSGFAPLRLGPGALVSSPADGRQSTGSDYPVIRPPEPLERHSRSIDI